MEEFEQYINHGVLATYADERVNLKRDSAQKYRGQIEHLKKQLDSHIRSNNGFNLIKMLHAGSVKKGTALSMINDMDVAVYVKKSDAPQDISQLSSWLMERLKEIYGKSKAPEDFELQRHCVKVKFHGTGLDVDVVPILCEDVHNGDGYLIAKNSGTRIFTNITKHIDFVKKRKDAFDPEYRQTIRFVKWWKLHRPGDFRFKSFMIELIVAHLFDNGKLKKGNFLECLTNFFAYIVQSKLSEPIIFSDYYHESSVELTNKPIQIFDPVNAENNVGDRYTIEDKNSIIKAAAEALNALSYARWADTKSIAEAQCKEIFGITFRI